MLLRKFNQNLCFLCGNAGNLTGEHKLKRSVLVDEFGNEKLYILDGQNRFQLAQSTKSKLFHFREKICEDCNADRTQGPDKSFDNFHLRVKESILRNEYRTWPNGIFHDSEYYAGSAASDKLFRYFSKILCCRLAESSGPIPKTLADHAIGNSRKNRVWLQVRPDLVHAEAVERFGSWSSASHGGLLVSAKKVGGWPAVFHSSISFGPVQYVFRFHLHWREMLELRFLHRDFYNFLRFTVLPTATLRN
ncbi:hypothetical protein C8J33_101645 [Rhizobium sp. PP-CC-3G-465]|nr:hypothetical protein C8J33_101645 [Rhizobium sp. PP-CC-3G-465]